MKMTKIMAVVMSVVMLLACTAFSASAANNVSMTTIAPGYINLSMEATGADGLGATLSGPWTTNEGWGYTYWLFTPEQIAETPYFVIELADETPDRLGGWCGFSNGYVAEALLDCRPAAGEAPVRQIIDLRTLATEGVTLTFCVTTEGTDPLVFEALYLTDDANGGGNTETGVESAVAVAAAAVIGAASLMVISRKK